VQEARAKATEALRARWGLQVHIRYGFKNGSRVQHASGHRAPTSAATFFHIHQGCSANVMIHHRSWRREVAWSKRPRRKQRPVNPCRSSHRLPLSEEELEVLHPHLSQNLRLSKFQMYSGPSICCICANGGCPTSSPLCCAAAKGVDKAAQVRGTEATLERPRVSSASNEVHQSSKHAETEEAGLDS
jgi:hypothetical protein